ncbi:ribonuclease R [Mycoplasmopsis gallinarum]
MINEEKLLVFLKKNPNATFKNIANYLKVKFNQNKDLTTLLNKLIESKQITRLKNDTFASLEFLSSEKGIIKFVQDGKFAFVDSDKLDSEGNIISYFIPPTEFNGALNGDEVLIDSYKIVNSEQREFATVSKILKRNTTKIIGKVTQEKNRFYFKPLKAQNFKNHFIKIKNLASTIKNNDVVAAKVISYENKNVIWISIQDVIGQMNDPMLYVNALIEERDTIQNFPKEVINEANKIADFVSEKEMQDRLDLRNELIVTIDGSSTKDFDDAINVKKIDENTYELGVHIADVSYYVTENSEIDKEALKRGTSIYLVDRVIPMLPEKLSNGICSLNPNVDRLTMSIIMTIDKKGKILNSEIKETVINSKYRLTYERVNEFLKGQKFEDEFLNQMLTNASELSKIIREYKNNEGYINFEIKEPVIKLDEKGYVKDIIVKEQGESEAMIEDFMVRANEGVAYFSHKNKLPIPYRIHEIPTEESIENFNNTLNQLGINLKIDKNKISPVAFRQIIEEIKEIRNDEFLKTMFLRVMSKAIYSLGNIGHFGLASEFYCHFTSPIRRYPDLMVHRIIREIIFKNQKDKLEHFAEIGTQIAKANSESEQKAVELERDTNDLKYAEYYKQRINQEFKAQIVTILKFGLFIEFENKTSALIHISEIGDGDFVFDDKNNLITNGKKSYKLGDKVKVVVIDADETTGKVSCVLKEDFANYLIKKELKEQQNEARRNNFKKKSH